MKLHKSINSDVESAKVGLHREISACINSFHEISRRIDTLACAVIDLRNDAMKDAESAGLPPVHFGTFAKQDPDKLIRAPQVSEITGIKQSTLAQWRYEGNSPIPYSKIGKRAIVYRLGDVFDYVRSQRVGGEV